jgi:hypothetical protein
MKPGIFGKLDDASILDKEYVLDGSEDRDEPLDKADEAKSDLSSDKALQDVHGRKVFVYFNLHKKLWSVKDLQSGLVVAHAKKVAVANPVFKVSEAGRQRVIAEQRKNVHAGVVGTLDAHHSDFGGEGKARVSYNPYRASHFYETGTGNPVRKGQKATLMVEEKVNQEGNTVRIPHLHVEGAMEKSERPGIFGALDRSDDWE